MIDDCFVHADVIMTFQDEHAHGLRYSSVVANECATRFFGLYLVAWRKRVLQYTVVGLSGVTRVTSINGRGARPYPPLLPFTSRS